MSFIDNLALGFSVALSLQNIAYCLLGTVLGTAIGVLPGLGPVATISMLLPITFGLEPTTALILLAGIYYGAQYGGSTTAILVNLPGETSSVVTAIDGYQMARQGRAREALVVAALGSFFAGTVGTLLIAAAAPALSSLALGFGAPEYFSLMVLGLIAAVVLAHGSVLKAVAMVVFGLVLGLVGTDVNSGILRFTFGITDLFDGIDFVAVAMGLFGIAEVISNLERADEKRQAVSLSRADGAGVLLSRADFRAAWPAVLRGTGLGAVLGILPGGGAILGSFASYMLEKKIARDPGRFGKGAIQGVAGPEAANNAGAQTSFIPMLTLGLPSNAVMAMMIGALIIHNIQPGPQVMSANPALFWGLVASMWLGNALLVVLNLPLVGVWVRMLRIPYRLLYPAILVLCTIGVYSVSNSTALVYMMGIFGVLGYALARMQCEPAPLLLGFVLGPMMEENFRRALAMANGDLGVFVRQPVSLVLLLVALVLLVVMAWPKANRMRDDVFEETT